ncbi:MAG: hypothetical protein NVSMB26_19150 [Beijerinckiaceae bacterium]
MGDAQIIRTPNGDELVVLPRAEYDALLAAAEMADDIAIYDARKADLAAERDEPLPAEVSAALLRGDGLLRALRLWRQLTLEELHRRTGLDQAYLRDLESGRQVATPEALAEIGQALAIDPRWLGGEPQ